MSDKTTTELAVHLVHAAMRGGKADAIGAAQAALCLGIVLQNDFPEVGAVLCADQNMAFDDIREAVAAAVKQWRKT